MQSSARRFCQRTTGCYLTAVQHWNKNQLRKLPYFCPCFSYMTQITLLFLLRRAPNLQLCNCALALQEIWGELAASHITRSTVGWWGGKSSTAATRACHSCTLKTSGTSSNPGHLEIQLCDFSLLESLSKGGLVHIYLPVRNPFHLASVAVRQA